MPFTAYPIEVVQDGIVTATFKNRTEASATLGISVSMLSYMCRENGTCKRLPGIRLRYMDTAKQINEPEEWRPVPNFEWQYEISSLGRLRSKRMRRILRTSGVFNFTRGNHSYCVKVARVVAEVFVPGRTPKKNFVIHKDGNHKNNRADNLFWATSSHPSRPVEVWRSGALYITYGDIPEAAKGLDYTPAAIRHACLYSGKLRRHPDLYVRFAEEEE